ncbi:hypothetical protein SKAU_G00300750 [Synaphobranchus kaupii]|uniref:Uncharacterized protein n=1 Tax=Synaphobranchus kaupii TaxID=118154 RepID=A0A9Q1IMA1_SYNKA|nr:hypothetical protein SKAU_G00300750 [Synaphobranchus kaupii]
MKQPLEHCSCAQALLISLSSHRTSVRKSQEEAGCGFSGAACWSVLSSISPRSGRNSQAIAQNEPRTKAFLRQMGRREMAEAPRWRRGPWVTAATPRKRNPPPHLTSHQPLLSAERKYPRIPQFTLLVYMKHMESTGKSRHMPPPGRNLPLQRFHRASEKWNWNRRTGSAAAMSPGVSARPLPQFLADAKREGVWMTVNWKQRRTIGKQGEERGSPERTPLEFRSARRLGVYVDT